MIAIVEKKPTDQGQDHYVPSAKISTAVRDAHRRLSAETAQGFESRPESSGSTSCHSESPWPSQAV